MSKKEYNTWNKGKKIDKIKYPNWGIGFKGKKHSEKTRIKISLGNKGKNVSQETKTKMSNKRKEYIKFHPQMGKNNPNWKGGRKICPKGYVYIHLPTHKFCDCKGYIPEHRLVIEKHLGRYLKPNEIPHHINNIKSDNRIENFMLFKNRGYHRLFHIKGFCGIEGIIFNGSRK